MMIFVCTNQIIVKPFQLAGLNIMFSVLLLVYTMSVLVNIIYLHQKLGLLCCTHYQFVIILDAAGPIFL